MGILERIISKPGPLGPDGERDFRVERESYRLFRIVDIQLLWTMVVLGGLVYSALRFDGELFSRTGALLVVSAIWLERTSLKVNLIASDREKDKVSMELLTHWSRKYSIEKLMRFSNIIERFAFGTAILGTFIWAFGDWGLCWVYECGWRNC